MAAGYLEEIRAVQGSGPYHLLGWSLGGVVAHEIAVQLQESGEQVAVLALLDAYPQGAGRGAPAADTADDVRLLHEQLRGLGTAVSPEDVAALTSVVTNNAAVLAAHQSRVFGGEPLLFVADANNPRAATAAEMWQPYASGALREFHLPCGHAEMARPDMLAQAWSKVSMWLNTKG
jgi:thioesterase domain-containing protein